MALFSEKKATTYTLIIFWSLVRALVGALSKALVFKDLLV